MKDYCFLTTKSTNINTKKIKQFFSTFLYLILAIVSHISYSSFMENLRSRFETPKEEENEEKRQELEFECFEECVEDHKAMELKSSSFNYENCSNQPVISHTLSDLGLSRKEREWRRTLACKLFQERHNVGGGGGGGGGEGMDMLWEVYEKTEEENRGKQSAIIEKNKNSNKNRIVDYLEEVEEDEVEDVNLCCLKAFKLSAGKMHFGITKPAGFFNISKAIKGIKAGFLNNNHHARKRRRRNLRLWL